MTLDLDGKVALITGAGAGIGAGIARRFAEAGAKVVVAERDTSNGRAVAEAVGRIVRPSRCRRPEPGGKRCRTGRLDIRLPRRTGQQRLGPAGR